MRVDRNSNINGMDRKGMLLMRVATYLDRRRFCGVHSSVAQEVPPMMHVKSSDGRLFNFSSH